MIRNSLPRVAFVSHSPWFAGAERALTNLIEHLPEQSIQPIVVFPKSEGPTKSYVKQRLGVLTFDLNYGFCIPAKNDNRTCGHWRPETRDFERFMREAELDAIVTNTTVLTPVVVAAAQLGIPCLLHSHGVVTKRLFPTLDTGRWFRKEFLQLELADRCIVPSSWVAGHYSSVYGVADSRVIVLPNGTEIPTWQPLRADDDVVPEFVMLCTLEPNKGVLRFLEAAAVVLARRPGGARFRIYGDGAPAYRAQLERFIQQNELGSACSLHPKQADVASIYRRCTAAIVASQIESFSFVAIEAMSHGRPVIATRCGGPNEIIEDGVTGYLVGVDDVEALTDRMIRWMDHRDEAVAMGARARETACRRFDIRNIAATYAEAILDAIKTPVAREQLLRKRKLVATWDLEKSGICDPAW